jgi:hypothetical protein
MGFGEKARLYGGLTLSPPRHNRRDQRRRHEDHRESSRSERESQQPYDVPDTETKDMNRSLMVLIFGMVAALASTALRSDKVAEARVAVEEIQAILKQNNEEFLSDIFRKILKFE